MIHSDFLEIKKALKPKFGNIQKIWATYANVEKDILFSSKKAVFNLTEEEQLVYSTILSKVLSGRQGKNLFLADLDESNPQKSNFVSIIKENNEKFVESFIEQVVSTYKADDNFAVLVAVGGYDVPAKSSDGVKLEGYDERYTFMICAICPTKLSKPNVVYKHKADFFQKANRDYVLQAPNVGFTYPAFEHRQANVNKLVYYTKKSKKDADFHPELFIDILQLEEMSDKISQSDTFNDILESSLGAEKSVHDLCKIELSLLAKQSMSAMDGEEFVIDKQELTDLLSNVGGKKVDEDVQLEVEAIIPNKIVIEKEGKFKIETNRLYIESIVQKVIDGKQCLVIPVENGTTYNDIQIN